MMEKSSNVVYAVEAHLRKDGADISKLLALAERLNVQLPLSLIRYTPRQARLEAAAMLRRCALRKGNK